MKNYTHTGYFYCYECMFLCLCSDVQCSL